jgi:hypothetical protein
VESGTRRRRHLAELVYGAQLVVAAQIVQALQVPSLEEVIHHRCSATSGSDNRKGTTEQHGSEMRASGGRQVTTGGRQVAIV